MGVPFDNGNGLLHPKQQRLSVLYDDGRPLPDERYLPHRSTRPGRSHVLHATEAPHFALSHAHRRSMQQDHGPGGAMPHPSRRFVAGDAFFNYESFGSLRPDLPPVQLFTRAFLGLAVNALVLGFVVTLVKFGYRQLLGEYLRGANDSYVNSISYLLEWPGAFALFLGLLTDCRPIGGRRRKPYMVIGWVLASVVFLVTALVDFTLASSWELLDWNQPADPARHELLAHRYGVWLLLLSLLAMVFLQVMYVASLALTVEFAQRESLQERGRLQATFFVLFYLAAAIAQGATAIFVVAGGDDHVGSKLSLGWLAVVLAVSCLVPVPFIVQFLDEPSFDSITVHLSLRRRVIELWRFCHHNVVIRVLSFLVVHFFLIGLYSKNARAAVATWSNLTPNKVPTGNAVDAAGLCLALIFWIMFMVNWSWRRIAGIATVFFVLCYVLFTSLVVFDIVRNDTFYILVTAVLDMPRAWIQLYAATLATEIADNGREGVTIGLVFAARAMVSVSAHAVSAKVGDWLPFGVTSEAVLADSSHTRTQVFSGSMVVFAVNLLAVFVVVLLPNQKLDAQQLRSFGGYNRYASYAIALLFALLFSATFAMNVVALTS